MCLGLRQNWVGESEVTQAQTQIYFCFWFLCSHKEDGEKLSSQSLNVIDLSNSNSFSLFSHFPKHLAERGLQDAIVSLPLATRVFIQH